MMFDLEIPEEACLNNLDKSRFLRRQVATTACFRSPKRVPRMRRVRDETLYLATLFSFACLFVPTVSSALDQTYFVDKTATGLSLGTEADPFQSIKEATDIVEQGDTVIVLGESENEPTLYEERINFSSNPNSGTEIARITLRAEPRRSVIMYGFETDDTDYLTIQGFQITIPQALLQSDESAKYALFIDSDNVEVRDNYLFEIAGWGIRTNHSKPWHVGGLIVDNHLFRCGVGIVIFGSDWLVEGNDVERLVRDPDLDTDNDYSRAFGDNITFRANHFHGTLLAEIGTSHVDGFQTFDNNNWYLHGLTLENNIITDFHQGVILESGFGSGNVSEVTIRNNVFDGGNLGGSFAVLAKWGVINLSVAHNLIANMDIHGVFLRFGAEGVVQNNIFYNAGSNYSADDQSSLIGLNNILNREGYPFYKDPSDIVGVDPLFTDPDNWLGPDGLPLTGDDGFRLFPGSPAIDAGASAGVDQDIFGASRPQPEGCPPDIGPVEEIPLMIGEDGCSAEAPASTLFVPFYRDGDGTRGFINIQNTTTSDQIITVVYSSLNSSSVTSTQRSHFILRARVGISWRPVADSAEEGPLGRDVPNNTIIGPDGTNVSIVGSASISGAGLVGTYRELNDASGSAFAHILRG